MSIVQVSKNTCGSEMIIKWFKKLKQQNSAFVLQNGFSMIELNY